MTVNKKHIIYALLVFSQQFWTIKFGSLSLPMVGIAILALLWCNLFFRINALVYAVIVYFSISTVVNANQWSSEFVQYTPYFSLISLVFWLCSIVILMNVRECSSPEIYGKISIICIGIAFISAVINSPLSVVSPQDGVMGFFNEKGLFGFYISLLSCAIYSYSRSKVRLIIIIILSIYTIFIIESARSLLVYAGFLILHINGRKIKYISYIILIAFILLPFLYVNGMFDSLIGKLEIISDNSGNIGRYAATFVTTQLSWTELFFGTGFGTYLHTRNLFIDVLPGIDYDYAGSFFLEMVVELGLIQTFVLFLFITKILYKKINIQLFGTVFLISLIGGKQDLQMIFCYIMFSLFYEKIENEKSIVSKKKNKIVPESFLHENLL